MPNDETVLDTCFATYRGEIAAGLSPAGADTARRTVRHRRRAATVAAATALVLITGPAVGYAVAGGHQPTRPAVAPASSGTPSPEAPQSPPAQPPPSVGASVVPPDGRIDRATLLSTPLNLPSWPKDAPSSCVTHNVRLAGRPTMGKPELMALAYGDADGDGAEETIAILGCRPGEAAIQQVAVFDRDTAGHVVTLGQVARTGNGYSWITDVAAGAPGSVRVQVGDIQPCCATPAEAAQKQWRTYGWNGSQFRQTDGPRAFGVNPRRSDLQLTATDTVFATRPGDSFWHGTVTVTIHNAGPGRADKVMLQLLFMPASVHHEGGGWSPCAKVYDSNVDTSGQIQCDLREPLAPGQTIKLLLGVADTMPPTQGQGRAQAWPYLPDLKPDDNHPSFSFH